MKRFAALMATLALTAWSQLAPAITPPTTVYCIDDSTEFTSVLSTLNNLSSHERNYELRFRPGTFPSNTSYPVAVNTNALIAWRPRWVTSYDNYRFKISGEWNAGCTAQNAPGGTTSTINGLDLYAIFYISAVDYTDLNYTPLIVEIDRIDFWRSMNYAIAANVRGSGHDVRITTSRFRAGTGTAVSSNADSIVLNNSLFENSTTGSNFYSLVDIDSNGTTFTTNNTFRNNTLPTGNGSKVLVEIGNPLNSTPGGTAVFENNILYQTTMAATSDLVQTDTLARVKNNILDTTLISGNPLFNSNNYNVNPKFAFTSGAQLAADSPARDLGNNASVNGATHDLYGRTRLQNLVVDIGAYEITPPENLFANSFE